jgi:hypothetical protein
MSNDVIPLELATPRHTAWEAVVLPLNYARLLHFLSFWLRFGSVIIMQSYSERNSVPDAFARTSNS